MGGAGLPGLGPLHGWQWLFLAQGLPSVAMGLAFLGCCPIRPKAWTG
jgi:ACS family tartrate transporter-like MFS transporter